MVRYLQITRLIPTLISKQIRIDFFPKFKSADRTQPNAFRHRRHIPDRTPNFPHSWSVSGGIFVIASIPFCLLKPIFSLAKSNVSVFGRINTSRTDRLWNFIAQTLTRVPNVVFITTITNLGSNGYVMHSKMLKTAQRLTGICFINGNIAAL